MGHFPRWFWRHGYRASQIDPKGASMRRRRHLAYRGIFKQRFDTMPKDAKLYTKTAFVPRPPPAHFECCHMTDFAAIAPKSASGAAESLQFHFRAKNVPCHFRDAIFYGWR